MKNLERVMSMSGGNLRTFSRDLYHLGDADGRAFAKFLEEGIEVLESQIRQQMEDEHKRADAAEEARTVQLQNRLYEAVQEIERLKGAEFDVSALKSVLHRITELVDGATT